MIKIVPYQPQWPKEFEDIKENILLCAGHFIESIDHIGSTSIPDLAAKDIIDIQIGVRSFDKIEPLKKALAKLGFEINEQIKQDHAPGHEFDDFVDGFEKRFFKTAFGRPANLHVRLTSGKNFEFALLFRDYLRSCSEARRAYEQMKIRLRDAVEENHMAYTLVKDPVCDLIYLLAKNWNNAQMNQDDDFSNYSEDSSSE
jgi:GrpB-like predicted nucleotidyltransferase (UPF0157 family)